MQTLLQNNKGALHACNQISYLSATLSWLWALSVDCGETCSATCLCCSHLLSQLQVAGLNSLGFLTEGDTLEERNGLLLPKDAIVLLLQVDKGVASLAMPDVGQSSLHSQPKVVTDHLRTHSLCDQQGIESIASCCTNYIFADN